MLLPIINPLDAFNPICNPIDADTLSNLLSTKKHPYIIIDCRFDYEYQAGHIKGAINIDNQKALANAFIRNVENLRKMMLTRTILIFHCEFSEQRAPAMWTSLRQIDRLINCEKYYDPFQIFYPEMYLLEKGFHGFF